MARVSENKNAVDIARLQATLQAHVDDFRGFRSETLEYHKIQEQTMKEVRDVIDKLGNEIRVFSGQMGALSTMQNQLNTLADSVESLEGWRSFILGGLSIISVIILPVAYLVISTWWTKHF